VVAGQGAVFEGQIGHHTLAGAPQLERQPIAGDPEMMEQFDVQHKAFV
jgi:hypothetical protein